MSAYEHTRTSVGLVARHGFTPRIGWLQQFASIVRTWRRRAHARAELARLDSFTLSDIGLDRSIVDLEVQRSFWRRSLSGWQHQARGRRTDPLD